MDTVKNDSKFKKEPTDILELKNIITKNKNTVNFKAYYIAEERICESEDKLEESDPEWTIMRQKYVTQKRL